MVNSYCRIYRGGFLIGAGRCTAYNPEARLGVLSNLDWSGPLPSPAMGCWVEFEGHGRYWVIFPGIGATSHPQAIGFRVLSSALRLR